MLSLAPKETILLVMRRHWIVFLGPTTVFLVLLLAPPVFLTVVPRYIVFLRTPGLEPVLEWLLALYLMGLSAYLFVRWLDYYLDVWIITDHRIIDIEQRRLFHREVSELPLDRVQNVTVEVPGFLATMLRFGNVKVETAGQGSFTISQVPDCDRAKDFILAHARRAGPPT